MWGIQEIQIKTPRKIEMTPTNQGGIPGVYLDWSFFFITALLAFTMTKVSEPKALGEGTYGKARN